MINRHGQETGTPTKLKSVINAFRPWTLYTAIFSVALGAVWALQDGCWDWLLFLLTLLGGVLLQAASNLFNTYGDYISGVDTVESALRSPELVRGELKPKTIKWMGIWCCIITALIGCFFIYRVGWGIIVFGLIGIVFAYGYTMGMSYKYHGLGLVFVFVLMGEIMVLGSYYVLAQTIDWQLVLVAVPNACLITAILNGNELRDYYSDKAAGIQTLSVKMGYQFSFRLYQILHIAPFVITVLLVLCKVLSPWTLLVLLTIPKLVLLIKNTYAAKAGDKAANIQLVIRACSFHWQFVGLMVLGLLLAAWL